jgi:integrase
MHAGLRLGEIPNLQWRDLDFRSSFILVRDSKNGEARHVPMDAELSTLFRNHGRRSDAEFIFPSANGGRLTEIRRSFLKACSRAGLTDLHFHDLRHTFASQFVMAGGDLYILKEILGHKSITMTQRYAHLSPAYKIKVIDRMNTLWQRATLPASAFEALPEPSGVTPASQTTSHDNSTIA